MRSQVGCWQMPHVIGDDRDGTLVALNVFFAMPFCGEVLPGVVMLGRVEA